MAGGNTVTVMGLSNQAPADHPLRTAPNCLLTCHIAWYSEASLVRLQQFAALEIARMLQGESPRSVVNGRALTRDYR